MEITLADMPIGFWVGSSPMPSIGRMSNPLDPNMWLSLSQAANEIGVSQKTVRRWIADPINPLPARRFSHQTVRIRRADLLARGEIIGGK